MLSFAYILPAGTVGESYDDLFKAINDPKAAKIRLASFELEYEGTWTRLSLTTDTVPGYPEELQGVDKLVGDIVIMVLQRSTEPPDLAAVTHARLVSKHAACGEGFGPAIRTIHRLNGRRFIDWRSSDAKPASMMEN